MRRVVRISLRVLLLLIVVAAAGLVWKRDEIARLLAVNSLFKPDRIVSNFSHMDKLFLTREMPLGQNAPLYLQAGTPATMPEGFETWIKSRNVTGIVVLRNGRVAFENYYLGTGRTDQRISWSVAKSFLSALMGIELAEGKIHSLDDQVTQYAPLLKGSAYDGATIRNVLNMASGVKFNEDYLDYNSDINRMGRVLALGGSMDGFAAGLKERANPPGKVWQYVSIDTHVIGMVIRGATGRSIPDLLNEKVLGPLGLEAAPYYVTDGDGVAFVLGGLNMTTRDYARFGQLYLQDGTANGRAIVPADWVAASTRPSAPTTAEEYGYGYQWWVPKGATEGEFMARGIYGQYIYVNRPKGVVIAVNAADVHFEDKGVDDGDVAMFRAIAGAL